MNFALLVCVPLVAAFLLAAGEDCVWNKDTDFPVYPPLLINLESWLSLKAVDEGGIRIVRVPENTTIVVSCSGTTITSLGAEVAEGTCAGGQFINIAENQYTIQDLNCTSKIKDSSLDGLGSCGDQGIGELALLGFDVPTYQFYGVVRVCFEKTNQTALYSEDVIYGESVSAGDGNPDRPSLRGDDYFYPTINPNDCYLTANQDAYFTGLLGDPNYIDLNLNNYFARGHLAPNADFLTDMEADSSYYYINAVPHWQPSNSGNWARIESDARDLAMNHSSWFHIYSGPFGILVLDDLNNNTTPIYICTSQGQAIIPVPELVWKVIYEPSTDRGVAVISSNQPYETAPKAPICPDIDCTTLKWITFNPSNVDAGFTYCCTVQDMKLANPHAPDFPTATLLTD